MNLDLKPILVVIGIVAAVALVLSALALRWALARLKRLRVPPGADYFTTLRVVPLSLVVGLDLLDLALDSLSGPIIWVILNRYNLRALRNVATIEALIPITGPIPTLTLSWIAARLFKLGDAIDPKVLETQRTGDDRYEVRTS
jgi:hypothetical protein